MAKPKQTPYRQEALTRVVYFGACFVGSLLLGIVVGFLVGTLVSSDPQAQSTAFDYSSIITFVIACAVSVYYTDRSLSRKFTQNP